MLIFSAVSVRADELTVFLSDGRDFTVDSTHPNWRNLSKAVKDGDAELFSDAVDTAQAIETFIGGDSDINLSFGRISVKSGQILYGKEALKSSLIDRIYDMMNGGYQFEHMLMFLDNLHGNTSKNSFDQLHSFLDNGNLPITPDGCFLAYKSVKIHRGESFVDEYENVVKEGDYVDKYTGTVRNNIGDAPWMDRHKVSDDANAHCSSGYHVGALGYAGPEGWYNGSGDVVIIVKVDPRDAVSVPNDHSFQKLRVAKYKVVGLYTGKLIRPVYEADEDFEYGDDVNDSLFDDDNVNFFDEVYLDEYDLFVGERIVCVYEKQDGTIANRVVEILEVKSDSYVVQLLAGDAKLGLDTTDIRTFKFNRMTNIHYLEL
jgi:hypothetical protein